MQMISKYKQVVLAIIYLAGILGLFSPLSSDFKELSFLQIIFCSTLVLISHKNWTLDFLFKFSALALTCFLIEVIGVRTGYPFGEYFYGSNLGPQVFDVPIIIALNWTMLIYSAKALFDQLHLPKYLSAFAAGISLVIVDFLIEQIAFDFNYWYWVDVQVPLSNYLAWFLIAFLGALCFKKDETDNKVASFNLIALTIFFFCLNIRTWF